MNIRTNLTALLAGVLLTAPAAGQGASAEQPPAGVTEREVTIGRGEWAVTGVLTLPEGEGPFPGAVLMHGSGPGTRDLDVGPNKVFREEAWGLAARGVAVFRYDKRATVHAARFRARGRPATMEEEFVEDGMEAVRLLQRTPGVEPGRVYVIGHSQSTLVAPRVANGTGAAGVALLAASARPAHVVIRDQVEYTTSLATMDSAGMARARVMMDGVERMEDPATPDTALVLGLPMAYWRSADPLQGMRDMEAMLDRGGRALVVQGGRDYLVTDVDFAVWQERFGNRVGTTLRRYADLNHLMQPGEGMMTPAEYNERREVSPVLLDDLAAWIRER